MSPFFITCASYFPLGALKPTPRAVAAASFVDARAAVAGVATPRAFAPSFVVLNASAFLRASSSASAIGSSAAATACAGVSVARAPPSMKASFATLMRFITAPHARSGSFATRAARTSIASIARGRSARSARARVSPSTRDARVVSGDAS